MKKYTLLSCALSVLLSGCGALPNNVPPLSLDQEAGLAKHVISIDRDGKLKPIGCDRDTCSQETYLNNIITGINRFQQKQQQAGKEAEVMFFVHGGLNEPEESLKRAELVYKDILKDKYPIFVIWDSRGPSSYKEHLWSIRQGEKDSFARYTSPIYFLTDVGNSIVNAPKAWMVNGQHMWDSIAVRIKEKEDKLAKEVCEVNKELNQVSYDETNNDQPINIVRRMRWVLGIPSKAIVTPFAYTMARPAWDIMLRRTNTLFYTPSDLGLKETEACTKKTEYSWPKRQPGSGALFSFLEKLNQPQIKTGINITLVGHSMGAIIVNKILILEPELPYKKIVHMASADSITNLFNAVVPYVNDKTDVNFYSLMLHPDNEDREEDLGGLVPSGSLLTWIDNMYTSPETVFDRRSGRWDNIKKTIPYLPEKVKGKMHFKIFGIKGSEKCKNKKDCPQEHGDFDEIPFWDKTTWE